MILGITGLFAAGKDTAAEYLETKGFRHISLSSILRAEAFKNKLEPTRKNLIKFGTDLKSQKGFYVLAKLAHRKIKGNTVITSIRHPSEVVYLKKLPNFRLIKIGASARIRYERAKSRARPGDNIESFQNFLALENQERQKGGGQELDAVLAKADDIIDNSGDFEHLYRQLDKIICKNIKRQNNA